MSSSKPPKKSEMLEVRLSYEDKQRLQRKAQQEGRSVSHVIRQLITTYVKDTEARSFTQKITESLMREHVKLKSTLAATGIIIAGALAVAPLSNADEIGLNFKGSIVQPEGDGTRTRTFDTDVLVDEGETISFVTGHTSTSGFQITFSIKEVEDGFYIDLKLTDTKEGQAKIIGEPKLILAKDGEATIHIGSEGVEEYKLTIKPKDII